MASNIKSKINLLKLKNSFIKKMKKKDGSTIDCLVIPIEQNKLFIGKDNKAVYFDLIHFPLKNLPDEYGNTHTIKQSFSKEQSEKMSKEEKDGLPFFGSSTDYGSIDSTKTNSNTSTNTTSDIMDGPVDDDDDLPF